MIVCCPSCQVRYRVPETVVGHRARCSRCQDAIPLVEPRRSYVVRTPGPGDGPPGGRVVGRLRIGMDDPALAGALSATALDRSGDAALTFRVIAPEVGARTAVELGTSDTFSDRTFELDPHEAAAFLDDPGDLPPVSASRAHREHDARPAVSRPARDLVVLALSAAAGATAGYHGALRGWVGPILGISGGAPVDPILIGGLLGLLVGWGAVRWMTRRR